MATTVEDRDQAARPRARWAMAAYRWLLLVLAIAASAGVQYVLVRRR
jgi:hypothetical protein